MHTVVCSLLKWNLAVLFCVEGGKPKNPQSKDENQQQTQPSAGLL